MNNFRKTRQNFPIFFTVILTVGLLFAWQNSAEMQSKDEVVPSDGATGDVTVRVPERGGRHVNFYEGRRLTAGANAASSQPVALVSADFDSDGFDDIVTADQNGRLVLLKGIDPTNFAIDLTGQKQEQPEPFASVAIETSIGITPDLMFAGDFNADGKQDIVASSKGTNGLVLLSGNGSGQFAMPQLIGVDGKIVAAEAGEIGLRDGQTDLAVVVVNERGSFIYVYEHPESAFKHLPEIIKLPASVTALAIGNTDEDFYSDIAVGCGSSLVLIHERGQAYPWDIVKDSGIVRPPAIVEARKLPFSISSLEIGRFGEKRGTSLALLSGDGNIYRLEPTRNFRASNNKIPAARRSDLTGLPFAPTDTDVSEYAMPIESNLTGETSDAAGNPIVDHNEIKMIGRDDYFKKRGQEIAKNSGQFTTEEIARQTAEIRARKPEMDARRKAAFLQSISARTSPVKEWQLETISGGSHFSNAIGHGKADLTRVKISDSDLDDLMIASTGSSEIQFVSRLKNESGSLRSEVTSIASNSEAIVVLPVRVNLDGLSDLVILQQGAESPSVVMSAPSAIFWVNTTNDTLTCVANGAGECSLRGAIIEANANPGNDIIGFGLPFGSVISPLTELPSIRSTISIQSGVAPDGSRAVEIAGDQITGGPADGLKVRASGCFIYGLAINRMPAVSNGNGTVTGGNGITLESTNINPNNGGNYLVGLFLGTDVTGNIARPNGATGMLIFDSDNNAIGGGGNNFRNVMSGNNAPAGSLGGTGLAVTAGNSNGFRNNIIGLNSGGTVKLGNVLGVFITGFDNSIGGDNSDEGNTVSGNGKPYADEPNRCYGGGVHITMLYDANTHEALTLNTVFRGNRIGADVSGTLPRGNCGAGIYTGPTHQTTIGSITQNGRNIIGDNGFTAIRCTSEEDFYNDGGYCAIAGNNIGADITGNVSLPNDDRNFQGGFYRFFGNVDLFLNLSYSYFGAPGGTTPGGACTGFCNLYSGNWPADPQPGVPYSNFNSGIYVTGNSNVGIFNNSIGVNGAGNQALANLNGITSGVLGGDLYIGGIGTDNGSPISLGNLISGQKQGAIGISGGFANGDCSGRGTSLIIQGNKIGTDISGTYAIRNGFDDTGSGYIAETVGILRGFADLGAFGGDDPLARNIISGNAGDALSIGAACFNSLPVNLPVANNLVGLNSSLLPLGNGGIGLGVNASLLKIGGTSQSANKIAYNGTNNEADQAGVFVGGRNGQPVLGVSIRGNSIHDNDGLGIDLGRRHPNPAFSSYIVDGVTANDCLDTDFGPNLLQNYPVLFEPTANGSGGTVLTGYLRGSPAQEFQLDFYSNSAVDPSGYGEGAIYIGSSSIRTSGNGFTTFTHTITGTFENITATATDIFGNTSEFSCTAGQCTDPVRTAEEAEEMLATSICAEGIVVNMTSDENDIDLDDELCDIDTVEPGLQCTLRAAIQEAEHQPGANAIIFNIPGGGIQTITPSSALPQMNQQVSIDATTQPGYTDSPVIVLNGSNTVNQYGLRLAGGDSVVRGMSVVNFKEGIGLSGEGSGKGRNQVTANYIGLYPNGAPGTTPRQQYGVTVVNGGKNNRIGGTSVEDRNVISGNITGISIVTGSTDNQVLGNYIGTNLQGNSQVPNTNGIEISNSNNNQIGLEMDNGGNLISGNEEKGISITDGSSGNKITGNQIGTQADGMTALPNRIGAEIVAGAHDNFIGGTIEAQRNLISGQYVTELHAGIVLRSDAGAGNQVLGNLIGVKKDLSGALPNYFGIVVNADDQVIGSSNPGDYPNLIGGSNFENGAGIYLHGIADLSNPSAERNIIQNNQIGTMPSGVMYPNRIGIYLFEDVKSTQIKGNLVGGNTLAGIRLNQGPHNNTISKNYVGISAASEPLPNFYGIVIKQADTNFVRENVVSGNTEHGIVIGDGFGQNDLNRPEKAPKRSLGQSSFAINNIVTGNKVGTSIEGSYAVPNGAVGIGIGANGRDNTIGGEGAFGNIVGGSTGAYGLGIFVGVIDDDLGQDLLPQNNKIEGNHVGVGIDFGPAAIANDYGIYVRNALNTTVGGTSPAKGNIVGYNHVNGIRLFKPNTIDTIVQNNFVGVTPDGSIIPNEGDGISIDGAVSTLLQENTVGGNAGFGIGVTNIPNTSLHRGNRQMLFGSVKLLGNLSGVLKMTDGSVITVPNVLGGLNMTDVYQPIVGEIGNLLNNVLAGNNGPGAMIERCLGAKFNGGYFGTDPTGMTGIGNNGPGIEVTDSTLTEVHQATLSGNLDSGLYAHELPDDKSGEPSITVSESNIGVVKTENGAVLAVKNNSDGMKLIDVDKFLIGVQGVLNNRKKNVISANDGNGLSVKNSGSTGGFLSTINHTILGTDESGAGGLGNQQKCVLIDNASNILIGSINSELRVVMSGCAEAGLKLAGQATNTIRVLNTLFGVAPDGKNGLGNGGDGVLISESAHDNNIGGQGENEGNTIAFNGGAGVRIDETAGAGNNIDPNILFANQGLGIDIGSHGYSWNDAGDTDEGPNRLQNYPEISNFVVDGNGDLNVTYKVDSEIGPSDYGGAGIYVEFFRADNGNEGMHFYGSDYYTWGDHEGSLANTKTINLGNAGIIGFNTGDQITGTATDAGGNTSEFFPAFAPTAAGVKISGRVLLNKEQGVRNAYLTLVSANGRTRRAITNGLGYFHFDDVEPGRTYVLTVSHKQFAFADPSRAINLVDELTDVDFMVSP